MVMMHYFKTSYLLDYDRSRDILVGLLSSVARKFDAEVIISRNIKQGHPEDIIDLCNQVALPVAKLCNKYYLAITMEDGKYYVNKLRQGYNERVILLEDVVGNGTTKLQLIEVIRASGRIPKACVVVLDRNEGAKKRLAKQGVELYSLTDIDMYNQLMEERKRQH